MAPTGTASVALPEGAKVPAVRTNVTTRRPKLLSRVVTLAAIAGGGSLGTLARYGTERTLAVPIGQFPWATFTVNVLGSFLLGFILTGVVERWPPNRFVRPFAAIGFCGGFTTFSTMVVEIAQRSQHGRVGLAALYLLGSLVAGLVAVVLGMALARGRFAPLPGNRSIPDPDDIGMLFSDPDEPPDPLGREA